MCPFSKSMMLICCVSTWNFQPICFPGRHHLLLRQPPQMSNVHTYNFGQTIWYTCSLDDSGKPKKNYNFYQFLMSQAWKCVSSVCGIVTNHMHGDNLFGVVMLGGFNCIPWHPAGWVFCYSFTVDMENVPATNPVYIYLYSYIYIYINLFSLIPEAPQVLADALGHLCPHVEEQMCNFLEGNERHQGHNI